MKNTDVEHTLGYIYLIYYFYVISNSVCVHIQVCNSTVQADV